MSSSDPARRVSCPLGNAQKPLILFDPICCRQLKENALFGQLCDQIHSKLAQFTPVELGFIFMAMRKFTVPESAPLLRDIFIRLQGSAASLDIDTLSYMSVALRSATASCRPWWCRLV